MIWNCFHCGEALAFLDAQGIHPTSNCKKLAVVEGFTGVGGHLFYACLRCGALQVQPRMVTEEIARRQHADTRQSVPQVEPEPEGVPA